MFLSFLFRRPSAKQAAQPLMQSINASTHGDRKWHPSANKKRTNRQARHPPKAKPDPPTAAQAKTQKPWGVTRETHRQQAGTRTNEQTGQTPKPKPYSTKATQAKTQESHGEAAGNGAGDKRELERTRTDKNEQESTKPSREKGTKKQGPPKTE